MAKEKLVVQNPTEYAKILAAKEVKGYYTSSARSAEKDRQGQQSSRSNENARTKKQH
jgi:hypothetical protein